MEDFRVKLRRNHMFLLENLETDSGLLDWLYQEEILTRIQYEKLLSKGTQTDKAIHLLVHCLPRGSPENYLRFIEGLKCTGQKHVAEELEKPSPAEDITESQAGETVQDGLRLSQNNCIVGFVHNVQGIRKSKTGCSFFIFHLQCGPDDFRRCLSFYPKFHGTLLRPLQENRQPVCVAKFTYRNPSKGYNEPPTMMITAQSHVGELTDEKAIDFSYKEMPIVYTPLDQLSKLNHGNCINVSIRVFSQGYLGSRAIKRRWGEEEFIDFQEKIVMDENKTMAVLAAFGEFVHQISQEEGLIEIMNVSVNEFQNVKKLSTNVNTTIKRIKA